MGAARSSYGTRCPGCWRQRRCCGKLSARRSPSAVAHSRFMAADRAAKDRWLLDTFGPSSGDEANQRRPDRYVVVASQVAEQSLDIDFDLLVTDLAPVDLILQRLGRLHRHERPHRPARLSRPRCLITGAEWGSDPIKPDPGSVRVYDRYALLRAAAVLLPYLTGERELELPGDIAPLVQAAYGDGQLWPSLLAGSLGRGHDGAEGASSGSQTAGG